LLGLLESRLLEQVLHGAKVKGLDRMAAEVAQRKKDPFTAVSELLAGANVHDESRTPAMHVTIYVVAVFRPVFLTLVFDFLFL